MVTFDLVLYHPPFLKTIRKVVRSHSNINVILPICCRERIRLTRFIKNDETTRRQEVLNLLSPGIDISVYFHEEVTPKGLHLNPDVYPIFFTPSKRCDTATRKRSLEAFTCTPMYNQIDTGAAALYAPQHSQYLHTDTTARITADDVNTKAFPKDFKFGVATASYQIEGAWNEDGKGENIWDHLVHNGPFIIKHNDTGDVACDSYHKYKEDVEMLKDLGVNHYRFSISWSRLLPTGFANKVNEAGVQYYKNLIKELKANGIEPFVTLYHWDMPQPIQELGGFLNDNFIDWFGDYAELCFKLFGDEVSNWLTFNEPISTCQQGYGNAVKAPLIQSPGIGEYICGKNMMLAHARAWHIYNDQFRTKQKGSIGFVVDSLWYEPNSNKTADVRAAEMKLQFVWGLYINPLINGDHSTVVKEQIARRSKQQGFRRSRLPEFTEKEQKYLKGTLDIIGLNHYSTVLVSAQEKPDPNAMGFFVDCEANEWKSDDWEKSGSDWLRVVPWGIRKLLKWIKHNFNDHKIIITENGYSDREEKLLKDDRRIHYIKSYLSNIRDAMEKDGVNVIGYTLWSLMDNFEWTRGYTLLQEGDSYAVLGGKKCECSETKPFPKNFKFGVATASYQIEGAWNEDGKGENIWDHLVHKGPFVVKNNDTGDVACDSYHKYKEDVAMLKELGVNHYRFSLSWTRLLPTGFANKVNKAGVQYYKNLIKELRDSGIEPLVTIYHWDMPQPLQELGGFLNNNFVSNWMTFNEPIVTCQLGYGVGSFAPAIKSPGIGEYICGKNLLLAHARAWHIYDTHFRAKQKGTVGFVMDSAWNEPSSNSTADIQAAEVMLQFVWGMYINPLINGDHSSIVKEQIARRSKQQGFKRSRLPEFTEEEQKYLKGTLDIIGLNHYTTNLISAQKNPYPDAMGFYVDCEVDSRQSDDWEKTGTGWLRVVPWGIRKLLKWVKDTFNNPKIIITENGTSDLKENQLDDDRRIYFIKNYLSNIRDAIEKDGVNVVGYTVWSLMDNFEWLSGYSEQFGLYHVDFNNPNRTRTKKKSADYYKKVIATRSIEKEDVSALNKKPFPKDFKFGVATASYQIEGDSQYSQTYFWRNKFNIKYMNIISTNMLTTFSVNLGGWNEDGKGENIWDHLAHNGPFVIKNNDTGDVACDSYHKYKEDVALLKDLGVNHYRFSISWSRLLPNGFANKVNKAGVQYYKNLIKELKDNGIEPFVTLYHWDLPQPLMDIGGFLNANIVDWFGDYAELCFELFGDDVSNWFTFNEPVIICQIGYGVGLVAPLIESPGIGEYICGKNLLLAHARASHIYDAKFRSKQKGSIGFVIDSGWYEPKTNKSQDKHAAEVMRHFVWGIYINPLINGDYSTIVKEQMAKRSKQQGFKRSRLPDFTKEEQKYLNGTLDVIGINHYSTYLISAQKTPNPDAMGYFVDCEVDSSQSDDWEKGGSDNLRVVPWGIRKLLKWVKDTFNNPRIIITENGFSDREEKLLDDDRRISYVKNYLSNIRDAMEKYGVNVVGYTLWSLMDNFEWNYGYTFGDYAELCFKLFGDDVTNWFTFNEPILICQLGYGLGKFAPLLNSPGIGEYICGKNLMLAHARAWHIYDNLFRSKQKGSVGLGLHSFWFEPESNKTEDVHAAEVMRQFVEKIAERSKQQGFKRSRLPEFTEEEQKYLIGTLDIIGLNHYTTYLVSKQTNPDPDAMGFYADCETDVRQSDDWEKSAMDLLKVVPWGIRKLLKWVKDTFNNPKIMITENGFCDSKDKLLDDDRRINYIKTYLSSIRDAMDEDGVNVVGYTIWTLMDSFEWTSGYKLKFGLYHVDFNSTNRTRTKKKSADYYKKVIATRCLTDKCKT
nr:unnamed protein product [Callosobruchus analis]